MVVYGKLHGLSTLAVLRIMNLKEFATRFLSVVRKNIYTEPVLDGMWQPGKEVWTNEVFIVFSRTGCSWRKSLKRLHKENTQMERYVF